jgi:hypothetical protein
MKRDREFWKNVAVGLGVLVVWLASFVVGSLAGVIG